jgi:hypothetical protein
MREHLKTVLAETPLYDGRTSVLQVTDATRGTVRVRILATAKDAPTLWDLRCYVREAMLLWIQSEMPDAAPAQRVLIGESAAGAPAKPPARGKKPAPAEHASDEGLFTGSLQAVERASLFMRGQPRPAPGGEGDSSLHDTAIMEPLDRD